MILFATLSKWDGLKDISILTDAQRQQLVEDLEYEYSWWVKWLSPSEIKILESDENNDEKQHYDSCLD